MFVRLSKTPQAVLPTASVLLLLLLVGSARPAESPSPDTVQAIAPESIAPLDLEERPEPFVPKQPRGQIEQNRLEAISMFSAARMLELDGRRAEALRLYQRALRRDPQAVSIIQAVIPLAIQLKRHAEAVRYALKAVEFEDADPAMLGRLGEYLAEKGDWQRAIVLYEKALPADSSAEPKPVELVLRLRMGRLCHLAGQHEKAAKALAPVFEVMRRPEDFKLAGPLKKLLVDNPDATYSLIGECFLSANRLDEAAVAFERAHETTPNKGRLNFRLARLDVLAEKYPSALRRLKVCFDERLADEGMAPYQLLADVLIQMKKEGELIERLEKLLDDNPENIPLQYFLAESYHAEKQFDEAETLYRELVDKTPTAVAYQALAAIYRKSQRHEQLLEIMGLTVEKASSLEPLREEFQGIVEDAELVDTLLAIAQKRFKSAPEEFGRAGRLAAAFLALKAERYDTAGEFFDRAIQAEPEQAAEQLLGWGLGLLVAEQYEAAAEVFSRGIDEKALPEGNPIFHFYLAGAAEMAGNSEQALAAAREAVRIKPDTPRFYSRAAWVLYHAERHDEAIAAYEEFIERFDTRFDSSEVREILHEARLVLSNLCVLTGRLEQAEEWLEQVLDEFPEDPSALNDLGYLWADANKNLQRARQMIEQALRAEPDNPAYRDSLGWVFYRLGRLDEAIVELEKAVGEEPDPTILDHLGDVYQSSGKRDKALDAWRRALDRLKEANDDNSNLLDTNAQAIQKKIDENQ